MIKTGASYRKEKGDEMTENKASKRSMKYDATHTKRYYIKLNLETDKDVIEKLEQAKTGEGVQTYLKRLIRKDN